MNGATWERARVDELDGLRAILALWVVACHMFSLCGFIEYTFPGHLQFFWWEFIRGASAVEVFMILSGFAISFLLNGRPQTYLGFMTGRFFRLYPVYIICLMLGVASTYLEPAIWATASWKNTIYFDYVRTSYACERAHMAAHLFWHFTLLNGLVPKQVLPDSSATFLPPAWSISLEWQYYLVAPLFARMVRSAAGILALIVVSILGLHYGEPWINNNWAFLPPRVPMFLIGIASYHLYEWFCRAGQPRSRLFALPIAALLGCAVLTKWHETTLAIWAVAFGCIFIRGDDLASRALSIVRWMLLHPWLQRMGRMSYGIYLIHWPFIMSFLWLFIRWRPDLSADSAVTLLFLIGLPAILCAAALLHEFVELPGMAWGKKLANRRKAAPLPKARGQ